MPQKVRTITHFIPLIGSFEIANKKLENKFIDKYYFSFEAFKNNEIHLINNYNVNINYLNKNLINDESYCIKNYKNFIKKNNIKPSDLQASIPPCGGLSKLNRKSGACSSSNKWIYESIKWFLAQDSECLVFENAPGLLQKEGIKVIRKIIDLIKYNGLENKYKMNFVYTNSLQHGLPQYRQRTFGYIYKSNYNFILQNKINKKISIEEFLLNVEDDENEILFSSQYGEEFLNFMKKNNILNKIKEKYKNENNLSVSIMSFIKNNFDDYNFDDFPLLKEEINKIKIKLKDNKNFWDKSPLFVKGKCNAIVLKGHYQRILNPIKEYKFLNVNECMQLMGIDNSFKMVEPLKNFNHLCQSVTINAAKDSLLWAIDLLDKKNELNRNYEFIIQDNTKGDLENSIYTYIDDKKFIIR